MPRQAGATSLLSAATGILPGPMRALGAKYPASILFPRPRVANRRRLKRRCRPCRFITGFLKPRFENRKFPKVVRHS